MEDFLLELGKRIKTLRLKCNYTQEELAQKTGYTSRSSINKIEKGLVDIPQSKIFEFALALGVTPSYIIFGDEAINDENEKSAQTDGLTEKKKKLIDFALSVPEDKVELVLTVMKSIV